MIIDTLTITGFLAGTMYLLAFAWFGKETLKVEELTADRGDRPNRAIETPCTDC
jgi:hypothetical protein